MTKKSKKSNYFSGRCFTRVKVGKGLRKIDWQGNYLKSFEDRFESDELIICSENSSWVDNTYEIKIHHQFKNLALMEIVTVE